SVKKFSEAQEVLNGHYIKVLARMVLSTINPATRMANIPWVLYDDLKEMIERGKNIDESIKVIDEEIRSLNESIDKKEKRIANETARVSELTKQIGILKAQTLSVPCQNLPNYLKKEKTPWKESVSVGVSGVYYVATNGNDSNAGTLEYPWRTIRKAADTLIAGQTAYVRDGFYDECPISFANSGTSGLPIQLRASSGETPKVSIKKECGPSSDKATIIINDRNYITLDGLTIYSGTASGLRIGLSTDITITNSH